MWEYQSKGWNSRLQRFRPVYSINSKTHFLGLISFYVSCSLRMLLQSSQKLLIWPQVKTYYFSKTLLIWVSKTHLKETRWKVAIMFIRKSYRQKNEGIVTFITMCKSFSTVTFSYELFRNFFENFGTRNFAFFTPILIFEEHWQTNYAEDTATKIPFLYSFSGNRAALVQISTFMSLWAIYILPGSVHMFPAAE